MSGLCSAHRGHDFDCLQCAALPVDKAELLYTAWCVEFAPEPSWWDEDEVVRARWRNVADILYRSTPENVEKPRPCATCDGRPFGFIDIDGFGDHDRCPDCTPDNVESRA